MPLKKTNGTPELGAIIRRAREHSGYSRETAARRVHISRSYMGQLECGDIVWLSEPLVARLKRILGPMRGLQKLLPAHNAKVRKYRSK
jgi:transcriptional regulator with XRE-family HTH domain